MSSESYEFHVTILGYFNLGSSCIGSGLAYQIYLAFRCTKASTSLITSHINNTHAQILKCITHAISFKGNHYNPTLVAFKILGRHSPYKIFSKNFIHLIYMQKVCQSKYIFNLFCGPDRTWTCDPLIMSQLLLTNWATGPMLYQFIYYKKYAKVSNFYISTANKSTV